MAIELYKFNERYSKNGSHSATMSTSDGGSLTARQAVLDANATFYWAFEQRNLEVMEAVWSHGTDTTCIHPGRKAIRGWESIRSAWATIFRNTRYLEVEPEILQLEVTGSIAYVVLIETVLQVTGGRQAKAQSMATNIFECMGQRWYLVHHHGSPVMGWGDSRKKG